MKKLYLLVFALAAGLCLWSCEKDDSNKKSEAEITISSVREIPGKKMVVTGKVNFSYLNGEYLNGNKYWYAWSTLNIDTIPFVDEYQGRDIYKAFHLVGNEQVARDGVEFIDTVDNLKPFRRYFFRMKITVCGGNDPSYKGGAQIVAGMTPVVDREYAKCPLTVSGMEPLSGTYHDVVTIKGEGFGKVATDNKVFFNGMEAKVVTAYYDSLKVLVPKKAGAGDVTVKVGSESVSGGKFDYVHEPYVVYTLANSKNFPGYANDFAYTPLVGLAVDGSNNLIASWFNSIIKVTPTGTVSTIAGRRADFGHKDGSGAEAEFNYPAYITINRQTGDIVVAEYGNHCIRNVKADGSQVTTIAGVPTESGYIDGMGNYAKLNSPIGIAINSVGDYFFTEYENSRIRRMDNFMEVRTFAGSGRKSIVGGQGINASIGSPQSIRVDSKDNLFVSTSNQTILKITPAGLVSVFYSNNFVGDPMVDIFIDSEDNVYATFSSCIKKITPSGVATTFLGTSESGVVDGGISKARFGYLRGITKDKEGNFYVIDAGVIRKIEKVE